MQGCRWTRTANTQKRNIRFLDASQAAWAWRSNFPASIKSASRSWYIQKWKTSNERSKRGCRSQADRLSRIGRNRTHVIDVSGQCSTTCGWPWICRRAFYGRLQLTEIKRHHRWYYQRSILPLKMHIWNYQQRDEHETSHEMQPMCSHLMIRLTTDTG